MGKVIAITNQKGGVGKSTTAINLSACLAEAGKKILIIDMDPQGNTTSGLGVGTDDISFSIYDLLLNGRKAAETIKHIELANLDLIPSEIDLSGAEIELLELNDKEKRLKKSIRNIKEKYDYVIIDCPPSLSMLTVNALTAADSLIIPVQCEYYALEGLALLLRTIELLKSNLNKDLYIEGILFTMYDSRTRLSLEVAENVRENLNVPIYDTKIPRNVRLAEAPSYGLPIIYYDSSSAGADSYRALAAEVIRKENR